MKGPADIVQEERAPRAVRGLGDLPQPKALRRQQDFLDRRGLTHGGRPLALDPAGAGGATRAAPPAGDEAPRSPYLRGAQQKAAMQEAVSPSPGLTWRSLGPAGIPHGQTYGSGPGGTATMAGRVSAIAVDPGDADHVLAGSAGGGIWQTRDGGASWTPQTDDQPTLSIGAMTVDPSDPAVIYAGTGEANSEYGALGQGILVSRDGGSTWTIIASETFAGIGFYRLVVDPRDPQRLIVATTGGSAVSTDGGTQWALLQQDRTWDVSLGYLGDEPEILLVTPSGLFAARGSGAPAAVDLPGLPPTLDANSERIAVAHVPSDAGQAFVFAGAGGHAHLWYRAAADQAFVAMDLPSFPVPPYVRNVLDVGQAFYDWHVSVPPGPDGVVYLGAIELVRGRRSGSTWEWTDISSRGGHGDSIHPDQHTMAFDPHDPDVIYAGNDGGIFRSRDGGDSWDSLNAGLAVSEVEYMTQRPDDPEWILGGLQDNGTVRTQGGGDWEQVALGDGGDCGTDMTHPDVCFHSYYYMALERSDSGGDADSWQDVSPPDSDAVRKLFYPPVEVNGSVVVKAGEVVFLSTDSGGTWDQAELPPPQLGTTPSVASALAIPSPERVLVGTIGGDVFQIERGAGGWGAPAPLTRPRDGWMSDLVVDTAVPERYWATYSSPGAVLRSDDAGATWIDVTAGLPTIPVNAVVTDPADSDHVWVACDVGVFESSDAGAGWSVFGSGLPNALAEDLLFHEGTRRLRVGTRSRGVWEVEVPAPAATAD